MPICDQVRLAVEDERVAYVRHVPGQDEHVDEAKRRPAQRDRKQAAAKHAPRIEVPDALPAGNHRGQSISCPSPSGPPRVP